MWPCACACVSLLGFVLRRPLAASYTVYLARFCLISHHVPKIIINHQLNTRVVMEDVPDRMSVLVIGFTLKTSDRGNSRLFMQCTSGAPKTIEMERQLHLYTKSYHSFRSNCKHVPNYTGFFYCQLKQLHEISFGVNCKIMHKYVHICKQLPYSGQRLFDAITQPTLTKTQKSTDLQDPLMSSPVWRQRMILIISYC